MSDSGAIITLANFSGCRPGCGYGSPMLALAVSSVALLIFDVVVDRLAGLVASSCLLALFALCWFVAPLVLLRGRSDNDS